MPDTTLILGLLAVVVVLAILAERIKIPYPLLLVVGGLGLGLVPGLPSIALQPDLVFLFFLPPLLYRDALMTSWRDFQANQRSIIWLAVGLVIFTTCGVAVVAHLAIAGLNWAPAFLLGAIVSSTDAVAASSIFGRLGVPIRVEIIVEGESLMNDASALVAYGTAVTAVVSGTFSLPLATVRFVAVCLGGIGIGLGVGWLIISVRRRMRGMDSVIETAVSLLTPFAAYLPAEHIGVSGVLAVVAAGLYVGRMSPVAVSSSTRLQANEVWDLVTFLINGLVFILIGLQLHPILTTISSHPTGVLLFDAALISLAVIVVRIFWVFPATLLARWRGRRHAALPGLPWRQATVIAWSGMRGVVALATALSLPTRAGTNPFPDRALLIFLTFGVILSTLLLQGLSLPRLINGLKIVEDDTEMKEERLARTAAAQAALDRLDGLSEAGEWNPKLIAGLRASYTRQLEHLDAHARGDLEAGHPQPGYDLRRELISLQRRTLVGLRDRGAINDTVLRRIQRELDLEEVRIDAAMEE